MKRIVLISALISKVIVFTAPVYATEVTIHTVCREFGETAATIMELRQHNVPMSNIMSIFENEPEVYRDLTIRAYQMQSYRHAEVQQMMISDFRNKAELECYELHEEWP